MTTEEILMKVLEAVEKIAEQQKEFSNAVTARIDRSLNVERGDGSSEPVAGLLDELCDLVDEQCQRLQWLCEAYSTAISAMSQAGGAEAGETEAGETEAGETEAGGPKAGEIETEEPDRVEEV